MSHELRTPLNGILGYVQILNKESNLTDRQSQSLKIIRESAQHLLTLIEDVLDFSKIEANKMQLYPVDFRLRPFLSSIVGMFQVRGHTESLIVFDYQKASHLPNVVCADEKRLRQILINLLSNAFKFTDAGRVNFIVTAHEQSEDNDAARHDGKLPTLLTFTVQDTGRGIAPDQIKRIFMPFEQGDDIYHEGTGLGLAITQNLVALMKGNLTVETELGQGSVLKVEIGVSASWSDAREVDDERPFIQPTPDDFPELLRLAPKEIAVWYDLAMKGELPRLREKAVELEALGQPYSRFAQKIRTLVDAFEEDKILTLIEEQMKNNRANEISPESTQ
jgi:signal transduction histidine kinase